MKNFQQKKSVIRKWVKATSIFMARVPAAATVVVANANTNVSAKDVILPLLVILVIPVDHAVAAVLVAAALLIVEVARKVIPLKNIVDVVDTAVTDDEITNQAKILPKITNIRAKILPKITSLTILLQVILTTVVEVKNVKRGRTFTVSKKNVTKLRRKPKYLVILKSTDMDEGDADTKRYLYIDLYIDVQKYGSMDFTFLVDRRLWFIDSFGRIVCLIFIIFDGWRFVFDRTYTCLMWIVDFIFWCVLDMFPCSIVVVYLYCMDSSTSM
jgi:hypothetical protein